MIQSKTKKTRNRWFLVKLRRRYGNENVVAGYITGAEPTGELKESGPSELADVTNGEQIAKVVKGYGIDTIYNLAALLSVVAESKPKLAWKIGIDGLWNILEVARENHCAVFTPSSIGSFGKHTPRYSAGCAAYTERCCGTARRPWHF